MRGQLYRGHANATALFSSPVVSALGSESDDSGSSPGRGKVLRRAEKKMRAPLLGLAKSIYYGATSKYVAESHDLLERPWWRQREVFLECRTKNCLLCILTDGLLR